MFQTGTEKTKIGEQVRRNRGTVRKTHDGPDAKNLRPEWTRRRGDVYRVRRMRPRLSHVLLVAPLQKIPKGKWFCVSCEKLRVKLSLKTEGSTPSTGLRERLVAFDLAFL